MFLRHKDGQNGSSTNGTSLMHGAMERISATLQLDKEHSCLRCSISHVVKESLSLLNACPGSRSLRWFHHILINLKKRSNANLALIFQSLNSIAKILLPRRIRENTIFLLGIRLGQTSETYLTRYKKHLKPYFIQEGLVSDMQRTLLGSSRVDIAALVLKIVLGKLLKENGTGYFYLPTSLFFGDGAHSGFRSYSTKRSKRSSDTYRNFAIDSVYEFTSTKVFEGVSTAYCCARFQGDTQQKFPVSYFKELGGKWVEYKALPFKNATDPWRIVQNLDELNTGKTLDIGLTPEQKPRQGVNTCGANNIFIFDHRPSHLPDKFLYPLATKEIWREHTLTPQKWILLPYHRETGKPLTWEQIQQNDTLYKYLLNYQDVLQDRKGTLLRAVINRENWWAMLGVGTYSFAPFKVIWEAYGSKQFIPIVLSSVDGQMWQGNQAMHAFIPCWSTNEAQRIKTALENPEIFNLLRQLNGAGKCNWAQPGKIKKILSFSESGNKPIGW